jgi:hypothetical protein
LMRMELTKLIFADSCVAGKEAESPAQCEELLSAPIRSGKTAINKWLQIPG